MKWNHGVFNWCDHINIWNEVLLVWPHEVESVAFLDSFFVSFINEII